MERALPLGLNGRGGIAERKAMVDCGWRVVLDWFGRGFWDGAVGDNRGQLLRRGSARLKAQSAFTHA
jgi:hypothetical protein